jgi:hypothetical protein
MSCEYYRLTPAIFFAFPTHILTSIPHRIADLVARISVRAMQWQVHLMQVLLDA